MDSPKKTCMERALEAAGKIPFRKRGAGYTGAAVLLFTAVLLIYIVSGVLRGLEQPLQTALAIEYESSAGCYSTGCIVREETVLTGGSSITAALLAEGQMAAAGQTVAVSYDSAEARQRQQQISRLKEELAQLDYAGSESLEVYDQAAVDAEIRQLLLDVAGNLSRGRIDQAEKAAPRLKGLVLRRTARAEDLGTMLQQADQLRGQIALLEQQSSGSVQNIAAPAAGYFSGTVDGLENILTPMTMTALSPEQVEQFAAHTGASEAVGKIIVSDVWYYLTAIPTEVAAGLKPGDTVTAIFSGEAAGSLSMTVHHIGQESGGKCAVSLSADRCVQEMTMARRVSADLIVETFSGLRVPKEAVRVDENGAVGVFVRESAVARWKTVEILHDNGESYIVMQDKTSTSRLWAGDEVIISGEEDLYDGKVISG